MIGEIGVSIVTEIAKKMIHVELLSLQEAEEVFTDIEQLRVNGAWKGPEWAQDLGRHCHCGIANSTIISWAWESVAKTYKHAFDNHRC